MKAIKSLLILFIVISLVFSVMSCKTNDTPTDNKSSSNGQDVSSNNNNTTDTTEEPTPEPTPEFIPNLNGRSIRMGAWWSLGPPTKGKSEEGDLFYDKVEMMQEKYNFIFEYSNLPFDEHKNTISSSVLAGDPFLEWADVENAWFYPSFVSQGILLPIKDLKYVDPYDYSIYDPISTEICTYNGEVYGLWPGEFFPRALFFWNKTIFESKNLPNLYELQKNMQWNWDRLVEFATTATTDTDADGSNDIWGFSAMGYQTQFIYSNEGATIRFEGTKPVLAINDANTIEALQFIQDLKHKHGFWDPSPSGAAWDYSMQRFKEGVVAIQAGSLWFTDRYNSSTSGMADEYGIVLTPMGPKASNYASVCDETNVIVFLTGIKDPDLVGFIYNMYATPVKPKETGVEGVAGYEGRCRDEESLETLAKLIDERLTVSNWMYCFGSVKSAVNSAFSQIDQGTKTPQAAIDEILIQAQTALDETMASLSQ